MTPLKAIRRHCLLCCENSVNEVKLCPAIECPLYPVRDGKRHKDEVTLSPIKLIRKKCLECSGYDKGQVKNCCDTDCHLYFFRLGRNPNRAGIGNKKINFIRKTSTHVAYDDEKNVGVYLGMGDISDNEKTLVEIGKL